MTTILATKVFTDPGHIIVIALPIIGVVAYLLSRRRKAPSDKREVFDPTSYDREQHSSPGHHGAHHPPGHGPAGHES